MMGGSDLWFFFFAFVGGALTGYGIAEMISSMRGGMMDQQTLQRYQAEQKVWAERNFPNPTYDLSPLEGIIEELGELAHARLKARQGIRGTPEQHIAAEQDAIADAMVFLMDLANRNKIQLHITDLKSFWIVGADTFFLELFQSAGRLAGVCGRHGASQAHYEMERVAGQLIVYAELRGWNFQEIFERTWTEVKSRDWIAFPETGKPPTGEQA